MSKKRYEIQSKISEGQFGIVYKALDKQTNSIVALKKTIISSKKKKAGIFIHRELEILQSLDHPNIIKLLDYKIKEHSVTLVLEYCEFDLFYYIENSIYPLNNDQIKQYAQQILKGIEFIHRQNIIHRDLKPSNILINKQNQIKIADFGSAIKIDQKINGNFEIEGFTRWYKSPEQLFGSLQYDYSIDIWAFGCIYAELLQGYPFLAGNTEIEQLSKISCILGAPVEKNWKNIVNMPDFGKITFKENEALKLKDMLPNSSEDELDFLSNILKYEHRSTAKEALQSDYFENKNFETKIFELEFDKREQNEIIEDFTKLI